MLVKQARQTKPCQRLVRLDPTHEVENTDMEIGLDEAEIRRQMYERIARGNALAEIEEKASRYEYRR